MAKLSRGMRKRGGQRNMREAGQMLGDRARRFVREQVYPRAKMYVETKLGLPPGITNFADPIANVLLLGEAGKNTGMMSVPLKGQSIDSVSAAAITETKFTASTKGRQSKALKEILPLSTLSEFKFNQNFSLSSSSNRQSVADLSIATSASIPPQATYNYANAFMSGNYVSGTALIPGHLQAIMNTFPTNEKYATSFYYLEDCVNELSITLTSANAPTIVDIYECVAKRDFMPNNPGLFGVNNAFGVSPYTMWAIGDLITEVANVPPSSVGQGRIAPTTIGSLPTDSIFFNQYWKVESKFRVTLSPGATHIHKSVYLPKKVINSQLVYNSLLIQGITRNYLIVGRGSPQASTNVNDSASTILVTNNCITRMRALAQTEKISVFGDTQTNT